jgi:hypothetical protein
MATMTRTQESTAVPTATVPTLLLAFELGERSWKLGFTTGLGQRARIKQVPARTTQRVLEEIAPAKAVPAARRCAGRQLLRSRPRRILVASVAGGARGEQSCD